MRNSNFDFPRLQGMAILYVSMQLSPLPLKITNQMRLPVTCPIHGTQTSMHISSWTSSVLSYSTTTTLESMQVILSML
jgi:hypothetical protein